MELHALKKELQGFFTDGLLIIVGCGLSSAEGLPGMRALGEHLNEMIPQKINVEMSGEWQSISALISEGKDIESALLESAPSQELEKLIVDITGKFLEDAEIRVVEKVINGSCTLRFTHLLKHLLKPNTGIPIITTNYDRLVEFASEIAGLGVDMMFVGHHIGAMDERECRLSFCRKASIRGRSKVQLTYAKRVLLLKPHGSLDWYLLKDEPVRCPLSLGLPRLIITPGSNKFRTGYDRPFDKHRERANSEIDKASRFLIIGYGFNDDHLETHLSTHLKNGRPALVLTHCLSDNGKRLIENCNGMIALTALDDPDVKGLKVYHSGNEYLFPGPDLWDVGTYC